MSIEDLLSIPSRRQFLTQSAFGIGSFALAHLLRQDGLLAADGPAKPGEQRRSVVDNTLAERILGWRPSVTLADGLRQTVDFFRARAAAASRQ